MRKTIGRLLLIRLPAALVAAGMLLGGCGGENPPQAEVGGVATVVAADATHPSTAIDPRDGRTFVAWVGGQPNAYDVYLSSASAGSQEFAAPIRVNDMVGDAAPHAQAPAQVAVGPAGELYVLWQNNTPIEGRMYPASDLRLAVSTDGGHSFLPAITVNDDAGGIPSSHTFHDIVVAANGTIIVSWLDSRDQDQTGMESESHHSHSATPTAAPSTSAEATAASSTSDIRVARSTDGGRTFSASVVVDENPCPCCRTALAIGPDGSVYVAWRKVYPGDIRDIVVARADPADLQFGAPVRVSSDDWVFAGCPHAGAGLAVDETGKVHVGWYTGKPDRQGLWYTSSSDGGKTFGKAEPIQTGDWVPPALVSVVNVDGAVMIAWDDRTGNEPVVQLARVGADGVPVTIPNTTATGQAPAFAAAGSTAFAAWTENGAIRGRWAMP